MSEERRGRPEGPDQVIRRREGGATGVRWWIGRRNDPTKPKQRGFAVAAKEWDGDRGQRSACASELSAVQAV